MRAIRIHRFGGPEVLELDNDVPVPEPGEGEVLVRVWATSVNPVDWKLRDGGMKDRKLPFIPGWDVAGTVDKLGPYATGFDVGDEVFARPDIARDGAYAEYIVVRTGELCRKPRSTDMIHAAAVPLAGLTAWQGLFSAPAPYGSIHLRPGQRILIHGGAGGVGHFAVQLARWRGAHVITTASSKNADFLRELGAHEVVDHASQRFEEVVREVDAVFDTRGGEVQQRSWKVLKPGGVLLSIISAPSPEAAAAHGARAAYLFVQPSGAQLAELAWVIDKGHVKPVVSEVLPLADARRAHELSKGGHVRGKIVLQVVEKAP